MIFSTNNFLVLKPTLQYLDNNIIIIIIMYTNLGHFQILNSTNSLKGTKIFFKLLLETTFRVKVFFLL